MAIISHFARVKSRPRDQAPNTAKPFHRHVSGLWLVLHRKAWLSVKLEEQRAPASLFRPLLCIFAFSEMGRIRNKRR